jgi:hypothetical protein
MRHGREMICCATGQLRQFSQLCKFPCRGILLADHDLQQLRQFVTPQSPCMHLGRHVSGDHVVVEPLGRVDQYGVLDIGIAIGINHVFAFGNQFLDHIALCAL